MLRSLSRAGRCSAGPAGARFRFQHERGVALVEFALIAPVLFLVLFAIVDFGRALNYWQDATHITNEGARMAAVNRCPPPGGTGTCQQYLQAQADTDELKTGGSSGVTSPGLKICISYPNGTLTQGDPVKVTARFGFTWLPILGLATSTITSSATMRYEKSEVPTYTPNPADCP